MRLISSCKHVFAIKHYIENEVTLGHNNTCSSKKQKFDVCVYRKSKKSNPPTKIGNVSLANHIPNMNMIKLKEAYQEKDPVLTLDHLMVLMYRFFRKIGKNLPKQQMVLPRYVITKRSQKRVNL